MADAAGAKEPPGAILRPAAPKLTGRNWPLDARPRRRADEVLLPAVRGLLPRGPGRAARPGVESCFPRRAFWESCLDARREEAEGYCLDARRRLLSCQPSRPRRCVAACCLGWLYTMLCWKPEGTGGPMAVEAPQADGMDRS